MGSSLRDQIYEEGLFDKLRNKIRRNNILKCKTKYFERDVLLMGARLGTDIERKDAEDIVQQFKGDKRVRANIIENVLEVYITSPRFRTECIRVSGESIIRHY